MRACIGELFENLHVHTLWPLQVTIRWMSSLLVLAHGTGWWQDCTYTNWIDWSVSRVGQGLLSIRSLGAPLCGQAGSSKTLLYPQCKQNIWLCLWPWEIFFHSSGLLFMSVRPWDSTKPPSLPSTVPSGKTTTAQWHWPSYLLTVSCQDPNTMQWNFISFGLSYGLKLLTSNASLLMNNWPTFSRRVWELKNCKIVRFKLMGW